jgi:hypothetical protein
MGGDSEEEKKAETYEVCESLLPLHIITSAGDVLVRIDNSLAELPIVAFFKKPSAADAAPFISPFSYAEKVERRPRPNSLARLGSLSAPWVE